MPCLEGEGLCFPAAQLDLFQSFIKNLYIKFLLFFVDKKT